LAASQPEIVDHACIVPFVFSTNPVLVIDNDPLYESASNALHQALKGGAVFGPMPRRVSLGVLKPEVILNGQSLLFQPSLDVGPLAGDLLLALVEANPSVPCSGTAK
jgi:hypothetical protein